MMEDKLPVVVAYCAVGLGLSMVLPALSRSRLFPVAASTGRSIEEPRWIGLLIGLLGVLLLSQAYRFVPWRYVLCSFLCSALIGLFTKGQAVRTIPAVFLGLMISAVLPWWDHDSNRLRLTDAQSFEVPFVTALAYWMLTRDSRDGEDSSATRKIRFLMYVVFGLALIYLALLTGTSLTVAGGTNWHHWGAYIGPAQLLNAGAYPLHDIPVQYGLGPTLAVAWGCRANCWTSFYWMAGLASIGMTALLSALALQFQRTRHPLSILATLAIMLACCMLWTAYPPMVLSPLATPSTSGMRFLPGVIFLFILIRHAAGLGMDSTASFPPLVGHVIWLTCILWSPEAGIYATALWVPYLIWSRSSQKTGTSAAAGLAQAILELILILAAGLGLFSVGYYRLLGVWPLPIEYVAYLIHPPGPLPINPYGPVLFALSSMACWVLAWCFVRRQTSDGPVAMAAWLAALLCFATFTYYLGRSHDNNVLNLSPFLALLLFATRAQSADGAIRAVSTTLLASLIGWSLLFGGGNFREADANGDLFTFDPKELTQTFHRDKERSLSYLQPVARSQNLNPEDLIPALQFIRANYHEPVEVYDLFLLVDGGEPFSPWDALHGPENFTSIPSKDRRTYLARVAKRLNRPGWVIYAKSAEMTAYLADYDDVYDRTYERDFGTYKAIRFAPRSR